MARAPAPSCGRVHRPQSPVSPELRLPSSPTPSPRGRGLAAQRQRLQRRVLADRRQERKELHELRVAHHLTFEHRRIQHARYEIMRAQEVAAELVSTAAPEPLHLQHIKMWSDSLQEARLLEVVVVVRSRDRLEPTIFARAI